MHQATGLQIDPREEITHSKWKLSKKLALETEARNGLNGLMHGSQELENSPYKNDSSLPRRPSREQKDALGQRRIRIAAVALKVWLMASAPWGVRALSTP